MWFTKVTNNKKGCNPCNSLTKQFEEVSNWDLDDNSRPQVLVLPLPQDYDRKKLQQAGIDAINKFISCRKMLKQSMDNNDISGLDLEHLLEDILFRLPKVQDKNIRRRLFQIGNFFDGEFNKDQKVKLYRLFKSLFYEIPMEPVKIQIIHEYFGDTFYYKII